jgi:hypothetical protein
MRNYLGLYVLGRPMSHRSKYVRAKEIGISSVKANLSGAKAIVVNHVLYRLSSSLQW